MAILEQLVGFVNTSRPDEAKAFYGGVLGFRLVSDDDFALTFDANGTMIRVGKARAPFAPAQGTVMGWQVHDIERAVRELMQSGVRFEQFGLPFMKQDDLGIWTPPNGDRVAWFRDPDGNVLSVSQHAPVAG